MYGWRNMRLVTSLSNQTFYFSSNKSPRVARVSPSDGPMGVLGALAQLSLSVSKSKTVRQTERGEVLSSFTFSGSESSEAEAAQEQIEHFFLPNLHGLFSSLSLLYCSSARESCLQSQASCLSPALFVLKPALCCVFSAVLD